MFHRIAALLVLSLLPACAQPAVLPSGERIGDPIATREITPFRTVHANPSRFFERTVLVEATTSAVCVKKGCWMQVEDGDASAMVRWESGCGGKYAFPTDLVGKRVVIQGSFYPKTISEEDAQHLEEEAGKELDVAREGYEFNASAVLVIADAAAE